MSIQRKLITISIDSIETDEAYDKISIEDVQELAKSIQQSGVIEPIIVFPRYNRYKIGVGRRRLKACKEVLGLKKIDVIVREGLKKLQEELMEVDENLFQKVRNPVERGTLLIRRKELLEQLHPGMFTRGKQKESAESAKGFMESLSEKTGASTRTLYEDMDIAESIIPELRDELVKAEVTKTTAEIISKLPPNKQKEILKTMKKNEGILTQIQTREGDRMLRRMVSTVVEPKPIEPPKLGEKVIDLKPEEIERSVPLIIGRGQIKEIHKWIRKQPGLSNREIAILTDVDVVLADKGKKFFYLSILEDNSTLTESEELRYKQLYELQKLNKNFLGFVVLRAERKSPDDGSMQVLQYGKIPKTQLLALLKGSANTDLYIPRFKKPTKDV